MPRRQIRKELDGAAKMETARIRTLSQVRIEQVLMAGPPLLLCLSLSQLLAFYTSLVDRMLGSSASLTQTLAGCRQLAARVFLEQLKGSGEKLIRYPPQPPKDLAPPPQVCFPDLLPLLPLLFTTRSLSQERMKAS